ncbi:hypothetical protein LJC00_00330 [Dysgonomonas sp. OttesenSCG-928-M03]|nr:hypothetical protein [Dysgonomonas sp. OttesenSCG-928-M03]
MEKIELRSEKVRNIVGKIPPYIIRSGITMIIILSVLIFVNCSFISVPVFLECEVTIENQNNKLIVEKIHIKDNGKLNSKITKNSPIVLSLGNTDICRLEFGSDITHYLISKDGIYITYPDITIPDVFQVGYADYSIENNVILDGRIQLKKVSLLSSFFNRS